MGLGFSLGFLMVLGFSLGLLSYPPILPVLNTGYSRVVL